ncbi:MAG: heme ABC exporter ATP-binding protein CcmA [Gemmatimonadetes bacterium]|nr:heme ABC exporter ATP-binding protein CcmA [Gemmatimonadota bacterium]
MNLGARLEIEGLTRYYGSNPALDDVSLALEAGEFLVVLGPNGAGKTTLVKTIARLVRPSGGRIRLDGEDWLSAPSERQSQVGMLSHATYLYDGLSAIENLVFYGRLYGLEDPESRGREALAVVGLEGMADERAGTMSRGQVQRLSIARAILHGPRLLLLDEPYAGLDPHAAGRLSGILERLSREGRTILLTTHDLDRAPTAASRYLVLVDGRVRAAGARAELPEFELRTAYEAAVAAAGEARWVAG